MFLAHFPRWTCWCMCVCVRMSFHQGQQKSRGLNVICYSVPQTSWTTQKSDKRQAPLSGLCLEIWAASLQQVNALEFEDVSFRSMPRNAALMSQKRDPCRTVKNWWWWWWWWRWRCKICEVLQGCYSWSVFGCSEFNSFVNVHDTLCDSAAFAGISLYVYVMFGLPSLSNMFCLLCTRRPTVEEIGKHTKQLTPREDGSLATRKSFLRTQYLQRCNDLITTSSLQIAEAHSKPYSR